MPDIWPHLADVKLCMRRAVAAIDLHQRTCGLPLRKLTGLCPHRNAITTLLAHRINEVVEGDDVLLVRKIADGAAALHVARVETRVAAQSLAALWVGGVVGVHAILEIAAFNARAKLADLA